jgi:hypothetical protein
MTIANVHVLHQLQISSYADERVHSAESYNSAWQAALSTNPTIYRVFHNVLCDYKHLQQKTKGPTLMVLFTATGKLKIFFLTIGDVWCVHHRRHGTRQYDIQVLATNMSTWVHQPILFPWIWHHRTGQVPHHQILQIIRQYLYCPKYYM